MEIEWEQIDDYHQRAKIYGGWLVKCFEEVVHDMSSSMGGMQSGWDIRVSMCFVPDLNHDWLL